MKMEKVSSWVSELSIHPYPNTTRGTQTVRIQHGKKGL